MDRSNVAKLVSYSFSGNEYGTMEQVETKREIYCSIESINRAEYFASIQAGLRSEYKVSMYEPDYNGEDVIELCVNDSNVLFDIYRTFIKQDETIELWCAKRNLSIERTVTLVSAGKVVKMHGVYVNGSEGASIGSTGMNSTSTVTLTIPQSMKAYVGTTAVGLSKPKAYNRMSAADKAKYFVIDNNSYFIVGDITLTGQYTYQSVNAAYDDVYRVQSVSLVNSGKVNTEYIEVVGR